MTVGEGWGAGGEPVSPLLQLIPEEILIFSLNPGSDASKVSSQAQTTMELGFTKNTEDICMFLISLAFLPFPTFETTQMNHP